MFRGRARGQRGSPRHCFETRSVRPLAAERLAERVRGGGGTPVKELRNAAIERSGLKGLAMRCDYFLQSHFGETELHLQRAVLGCEQSLVGSRLGQAMLSSVHNRSEYLLRLLKLVRSGIQLTLRCAFKTTHTTRREIYSPATYPRALLEQRQIAGGLLYHLGPCNSSARRLPTWPRTYIQIVAIARSDPFV